LKAGVVATKPIKKAHEFAVSPTPPRNNNKKKLKKSESGSA
jgi:hypothetical protein